MVPDMLNNVRSKMLSSHVSKHLLQNTNIAVEICSHAAASNSDGNLYVCMSNYYGSSIVVVQWIPKQNIQIKDN